MGDMNHLARETHLFPDRLEAIRFCGHRLGDGTVLPKFDQSQVFQDLTAKRKLPGLRSYFSFRQVGPSSITAIIRFTSKSLNACFTPLGQRISSESIFDFFPNPKCWR
jgi:hypothetical protein